MDESSQPTNSTSGESSMTKWLVVLIVGIIVVGGIFYFFSASKKGTNTPQATISTTQPTVAASASPMASPEAAKNLVTLTSQGFSPATITIKAGETVTWENNSGSAATVNSDPHPTHTNYPPFNLGTFQDGDKLSLSFSKAGTYGYHNHFDPSQKGTVIVE